MQTNQDPKLKKFKISYFAYTGENGKQTRVRAYIILNATSPEDAKKRADLKDVAIYEIAEL